MKEALPIDGIISEIKEMHDSQPDEIWSQGLNFTEDKMQRWSLALGTEKRSDLYDALALRVASGFNTDDYSFHFCDDVVNRLFLVIDSAREPFPPLFWSVFLAFDAGESYREDDGEDPIDKYTRPQIANILREYDRRNQSS